MTRRPERTYTPPLNPLSGQPFYDPKLDLPRSAKRWCAEHRGLDRCYLRDRTRER